MPNKHVPSSENPYEAPNTDATRGSHPWFVAMSILTVIGGIVVLAFCQVIAWYSGKIELVGISPSPNAMKLAPSLGFLMIIAGVAILLRLRMSRTHRAKASADIRRDSESTD